MDAAEANHRARLPALDGLRAVSMALVFVFHLTPSHLPGGYIGVDIFFAISGYLITSLLLEEHQRSGTISISAFYWRRAFRIWPALVALLLASAIASPLLFAPIQPLDIILSFGALNWARAFDLTLGGWLGHMWSLSVEEQFYALWPLLLLVCLRVGNLRALRSVALLLLVAGVSWRVYLALNGAGWNRTYNGTDTHADGLLFGCLLAAIPHEQIRAIARRWSAIPVAIMAGIALLVPYYSAWMTFGGFTVAGACGAWLVLLTTDQHWVGSRVLGNPLARYVGRLSYSIYLWHYPVMHMPALAALPALLRVVAVVASTALLAMASYHFIELPILRLGRKLRSTSAETASTIVMGEAVPFRRLQSAPD